jgi:hypothetical protein
MRLREGISLTESLVFHRNSGKLNVCLFHRTSDVPNPVECGLRYTGISGLGYIAQKLDPEIGAENRSLTPQFSILLQLDRVHLPVSIETVNCSPPMVLRKV